MSVSYQTVSSVRFSLSDHAAPPRPRGVEDMVVAKLHVGEPQECKNLQAVVVCDAKRRRIRIEGEHLTGS